MNNTFSCIKNSPEQFFTILPLDWQNVIVAQWDNFKKTSSIYVFKENNKVIAGGIVFEKSHPNMNDFEKQHQKLYDEGYFYLGFIWVIPEKRNQQLASKWLTKLKEETKNQKYWLTIEEESLKYFYKKNGFELIAESEDFNYKEWIFIFNPE